jgi:hypothetical protein
MSDREQPCPGVVYCESAAVAFDPDIYDCAPPVNRTVRP